MINTQIDYKKELEAANKAMTMIHDPALFIKIICRTIVRKAQIQHAGVIMHSPVINSYVLKISSGNSGVKIPAGFFRFEKTHPFISIFTNEKYKPVIIKKKAIIRNSLRSLSIKKNFLRKNHLFQHLLNDINEQMYKFNVAVSIPSYYRNKFLAVFLLGEKNDGSSYNQRELDFFSALVSSAAMAIRNAQLFDSLKYESSKNRDLFIRTTSVLGAAIEAKDKYTHGHTNRVTDYAIAIAKQMIANQSANFSEKFMEDLFISGMLHDIGKIGVPEAILNKPGKLLDCEFNKIKRHPTIGVEILEPLSELKESIDGVNYHHERYDGNGYPKGLKGEEIPIIAAILSVADSFDAMISDRPYRKGLNIEVAIMEIISNSGKQFHPLPAQALIELFEAEKI